MPRWPQNAIFYHIYPLGLLNAPQRNDFTAEPVTRLQALTGWLDHISRLGCNALYLGPVFESTTHGYDTADYYHVDRRLGTRQTLADFVRDAHQKGIRVVLDAVWSKLSMANTGGVDLLAARTAANST